MPTKLAINRNNVHDYNADIKSVLRGNGIINDDKLLEISNIIYIVPFNEWKGFGPDQIIEGFFRDFEYIASFSKSVPGSYVQDMKYINFKHAKFNKFDDINYLIKYFLKDYFKTSEVVNIADKFYYKEIKSEYNYKFDDVSPEILARIFLANYGDYKDNWESQRFVSFIESIPFSDLKLDKFHYDEKSFQKYKLIEQICKSNHIEVHGSYLHGTEKPKSDIDLLSFLNNLDLESVIEDIEFISSMIEDLGFDKRQYKIGEIQNNPNSDKYNSRVQTQVPFIIRDRHFEPDEEHIEGALQSLDHDIYINLKIAEIGSRPYRQLKMSKGIGTLPTNAIPITSTISKYVSEMFKNNGMEDDRYGYPRGFIIPLIIFIIESNSSQLEELLRKVSHQYETDWLGSSIKAIQNFRDSYSNNYLDSPLLESLPITQKVAYGFSIIRNMNRESFNKLKNILPKGKLEIAINFNISSKLAINEVIGMHFRKLLLSFESSQSHVVDMTMFTNTLKDYADSIDFNTILKVGSHFASRSLNRIVVSKELIDQLSNMSDNEKFKLINKDSYNRRFFRFEGYEEGVTRHINYGVFNTSNYEIIVSQYFDRMLSYVNYIKKSGGLKEGTEDYQSAFKLYVGIIDDNKNIKWEEIDLNERYYEDEEGYLVKNE